MKHEFYILAALIQLEHPNTTKIVDATGIAEHKVQSILRSLQQDFEVKISRHQLGKNSYLSIDSWGVFESGGLMMKKLELLDLKSVKKIKLGSKKIKSILLTTFREKYNHFEKFKIHNFKESMRLEGISVDISGFPSEKDERNILRKKLIKKYSQYKNIGSSVHA